MPSLPIRALHVRAWAFARDVAAYAGPRGVQATAFVALGAVLEGVGVLVLVPLLGALFADQVAPAGWDWLAAIVPPGDPVVRLAWLLAIFGAIMVLRAVVLLRRDTLLGELQVGFVEAQRRAVAQRLAGARWETLSRLGHGRVTHLMSGDIQRCGAGVQFLLQGGVAVVMLSAQVVLALVLAPLPALLAVVLLALGGLALAGLFKGAHGAGARVTAANLALMIGLGQFLGGLKMAMSQNLQSAFVQGFDRELAHASAHQVAFLRQQALLRGLWTLIGAAAAGVVLLFGYGVLHLAPAVLLALLVLLARIGGPASQLQLGFQQIAYSLSAWEAVRDMKAELDQVAPAPARTPSAPLSGPVVFEGVAYRHDREAGVRDLDLTLAPGTFLGVSGSSGSGKTTFADLLAGLLAAQSGRVRVGDARLDEDVAAAWRDQVAYVAQDPVLFNDTIRNNLLWARPDATEADLLAALAVSGGDRLVAGLPQGLDTVVGEAGALVSGGERQRLALARALLRRPRLLILDEATSAIDIPGERAILQTLAKLEPRPTIVMIAHRPESFAVCDRVVAFADGRLQPVAP